MTRDAWKNRDEAIDGRSEASRGSARAARSKTEATMGRRTVTATPTIGSFISVREEAGTGSGRLFSDRAVLTHRAAAAAATGYPLIAVSLPPRVFQLPTSSFKRSRPPPPAPPPSALSPDRPTPYRHLRPLS